MLITSNILGELGRAIKLAVTGPHETEVLIPATIQNVSTLRNVLTLGGPPGNINQTSVATGATLSVANSVSASTVVVNLAAGIWELDVQFTYSANYATTDATGGQGRIGQVVSAIPIFSGFTLPTAGGVVAVQQKLTVNFDAVSFIDISLQANGAGQTHTIRGSILAHRLI